MGEESADVRHVMRTEERASAVALSQQRGPPSPAFISKGWSGLRESNRLTSFSKALMVRDLWSATTAIAYRRARWAPECPADVGLRSRHVPETRTGNADPLGRSVREVVRQHKVVT